LKLADPWVDLTVLRRDHCFHEHDQSVLQLIQSTRANVSTQTFGVEMVWEWLSHVGLVLKASFFLIIDSPCAQRCGKPFDLFRKFSESPMKNKEGKAC
jgi:predicted nucleic acid-binding Zn ribbon protein